MVGARRGGRRLGQQRLKLRFIAMQQEMEIAPALCEALQTFNDDPGRVVAAHPVDGYDFPIRHVRRSAPETWR